MSSLTRWALVLAVATAVLMFLPGTSVLGAAHPSALSAPVPAAGVSNTLTPTALPAAGHAVVSPAQATVARLQAALTADHVPPQEQLLPSASPAVTVHDGMISPGSPLAPQPMGIADYGISEVHGKNVASISYTPGVEGVLNLTELHLLYFDSVGPDEFTAQLNSVATGVTVRQDSDYQFWTQNVIYYQQSNHLASFADAVVNFSNPASVWGTGVLVPGIGHGYIAPGFGYFDPFGPMIYAPEPFTVAFFSNLSIVNHHPAVTFGYSITSSAGTSSGTYDMIEFNSTIAHPPTPTYQINGEAVGDTGFIPNDVELILGGDGGGSTTSALSIQGTMNLYIQHNGTRQLFPVPSAWDFGSETGETIEGVSEWASGGPNPTVHLGTGPSLQTPLWGVLGAPPFGQQTFSFHVQPANAFVFASAGSTFDPGVADWAFVPPSGMASYALPPGTYSFQILLSEYASRTLDAVAPGGHTVKLTSDPSLGVYTPLWAYGNAELAAISDPGGSGSVGDPYVLVNGPIETLNPLFGQYNDYMFPVFPGIQLADTSAYVTVADETPFEVQFSLPSEQYYAGVLPLDNELSYGLYNASHVSLVSNLDIGGWINYAVYGQASLVMWNSSDDLLAGNVFPDASLGLYAYGGTDNVIWGNAFELTVPTALDPAFIENYGNSVALDLYESGNLIYNNYFGTPQTAFTPPIDPYSFNGIPAVWTDRWNVVQQPATDVRVVNGWSLSGNILGLPYEGGNFWSNYGTASDPYGILPYDNGGNLIVGGDHVPLLTFALYSVTFTEKGLPTGTAWSVTLNGITESSKTSSITFWDPNGLYAYAVGPVKGHTPHPSIGAVEVSSASQTVSIHWT
jgi:thermopsin